MIKHINFAKEILNYCMGIHAVIDQPYMASIIKNIDILIQDMTTESGVCDNLFKHKNDEIAIHGNAEEDWSEVYVKDWFTTRTSNCLLGECINTINDLLEYSAYQLRKIPGLGNKSLREIEEYLSQNNLSFKGNKNV